MASGKGCDNEKNMTSGNRWDSEKMLRLYIYNYMKEKGLHDAADVFAKEANLEMFKTVDSDKGLLKEWWKLFWPQFSSRLGNEAEGSSQSFEQLSMKDIVAILASLEKQGATSSQHTPVGNPQHNVVPTPVSNQQMIASGGSAVVNVMEQPPVSLSRTPPVISQRRAGKLPVSTDTDSILRKSSAPSCNPSNLHLPVTMQFPVQVTGDPRNDAVAIRSEQTESNWLGQNSAYPPPGFHAGLSKFLKK